MLSHAFACLQAGLQSLAFQNVGCSIRACQAVQELVQNSQELRTLHLFNNMSDNEGAVAIGQVLPVPPSLGTSSAFTAFFEVRNSQKLGQHSHACCATL